MINTEKAFNIHDYVEILLRRIWYILIPLVVILSAAVLYASYAPKEYRATTTILVIPQRVPEAFVRSTVTERVEERLQSLVQDILSRTRLEQVITEFKLYSEEGKSFSAENIVELMRKNIQIEFKGRESSFAISYIGKDPKVVTTVANRLGSLLIEENSKLREQQAQGTSEFLSGELSATKTKLEREENAIIQFKRRYMGELPEQRDATLKLLEQLQLQYQRVSDNLRSAQDRKLVIQKQLSDMELLTMPVADPLQTPSKVQVGPKNGHEIQLEQLKNQLAELRMKYTEKHPDILVVKKKISDLEKQVASNRLERELEENRRDKASAAKMESKRDTYEGNSFYKEMETQLIAVTSEIQKLKAEEANMEGQIAKYRERTENTFLREQSLATLTRDHQNTSETYQALLKKTQEARQAENLERRQKGEQFKVIDRARVPERPFKPNIPRVLLFGLLLGMGCGFGSAFFKEQADSSFRDAEDLETTLGFKVLANIPKIKMMKAA
jgi:polysaccharide chain length determinant protein (PEP-CTERM system associated)